MSTVIVEEPEREIEDEQPGRRRRAWLLPVVIGAGVLAGGVVLYWLVTVDGGASETIDSTPPASTAEVMRETIADTRSFDGTLGHGDPVTVLTSGQGVVTRLAEPGTQVARGAELYRLNEQPVSALFGVVPMYRDLAVGMVGADVEQLIDNLTELGHADCEATNEFTTCIEAAVREWQAAIGADETGTVARWDVVFTPEGTRVDAIRTGVGGMVGPGSPILDLAHVDQVVGLAVEVRDRSLLALGAQVSVRLPGGTEVAGTVTSARVVPVTSDAGGPGGDDSAGPDDTLARVEVTLDEEVDEALVGAPAQVNIELGERPDVLTVPVKALLALAEGGHGVEVVNDDGTTSLVEVETGLFAGGRVEITGPGITEGTEVVVAGR